MRRNENSNGKSIFIAPIIHSLIRAISIAPLQVQVYSVSFQTTALILHRNKHAEALQATVGEGLARGPYVTARVRFKSATIRTQGTEPDTEPPLPIVPVSSLVEKGGGC